MKVLLLYILLSSPVLMLAQTKFINLTSTDPDYKELYIGVENYIELGNPSYFINKLRFSISHGELTKMGGNKYLIKVDIEKPDTLNFYEDDKLVLSEVYQVKAVSSPVARLANLKDTFGTIRQIVATPFISVYLPECNYKHQFQIHSFRTRLSKSNKVIISVSNTTEGNSLTYEQIRAIKTLKANDKIQFYDIIYTCPDCKNGQLPPFTMTIK